MPILKDLEKKINSELTTKIKKSEIKHEQLYLYIDSEDLIDVSLFIRNNNNTKFIPVDSEHFSLWYGLKNIDINKIEEIYLTASGGPFHKTPLNNFKNITIKDALNHPNWKMGKKISVDSATLINKIFEVIEAKNIFNIPYNKIKILIHPKSYIHAMIRTNDGLIKIGF